MLTKDVTGNMGSVSSAAGQTNGTAGKLSESAGSLSRETEEMSTLFERFMGEINSFEELVRGQSAD